MKTNLQRIREDLNLSRRELANKLGVTEQIIFSYEKRGTIPRLDVGIAYANALDITPQDLLKEIAANAN